MTDKIQTATPLRLDAGVQHYAWGDPEFLPAFLGVENPDGRPFAELWIGAHPKLAARALTADGAVPLDALLEMHGEAWLGAATMRRFGRLPFLLKVLTARCPLSIQSHPSKAQAEAGFARENAAGVPLDAPERNYRDDNHKPELIVALTEFWGLRGFRPLDDIAAELAATPELAELAAGFEPTPAALGRLFATLMSRPQAEVDAVLGALVARVRAGGDAASFDKSDRRHWLLRADETFAVDGHRDRGLFAVLLLNLVRLEPGQAMYLPAQTLHAYLEGAGVEIMANSDNVLRGGLTPKHIDVPELLATVDFRGETPSVLEAEPAGAPGEAIYRTPAAEFELRRVALAPGAARTRRAESAEVLAVIAAADGDAVTVSKGEHEVSLRRGESCFVPLGCAYSLGSTGEATVVIASVPPPPPPSGGSGPATRAATAEPPSFRGRRPTPLRFGTSGLRGLVTDITDLEAAINTRGFLEYLVETGEARRGDTVSIAGDLRPSTDSESRSILRAVAFGTRAAGFVPEYLGKIPTPALTFWGLEHARPSVMVTGSHIPFDRNGIKFNKTGGEVLKSDEAGILAAVERVRREEYARPAGTSPFDDDGMLRDPESAPLPAPTDAARRRYVERALDFFGRDALAGLRLVLWEHSAVGREVLAEILRGLGAEVFPYGRSTTFVAIDTEALGDDTLREIQRLADEAREALGRIDAVVSTDGDSDRPLLVGIDDSGRARFFGGDRLGLLVAELLEADFVAVPISATDAIDLRLGERGVTPVHTRIGSPFVIAAMQEGAGKRRVGWEANGGFLTGTPIERDGRTLAPLPTRDAVLPIVTALAGARARGVPLGELFDTLPERHGAAGLLDEFPLETSRALIDRLSPGDADVRRARFTSDGAHVTGAAGEERRAGMELATRLCRARDELERVFTAKRGFGRITWMDFTDGVRFGFNSGDIAHVRPSGNAPQLRIYAVAGMERRAAEIVALGIREPDGLLRELEAMVRRAQLATSVSRNLELTARLLDEGRTPELIGTVCGSSAAQRFWQRHLDAAREVFGAREAVSFHEDLPTNQAFGVLLLWQRLRERLREERGALVAFVFGDGTRSTPFTETDNGQKPAIATFVRARARDGSPRRLSMVELALRSFVPVQQYLWRSGFRGLVVKWGDEVQVPALDLAGSDPLFEDADVVRFVSMRAMNEDEAANKDWVGVAADGRVTAFVPRRPLADMEPLAERGLLRRQGGRLVGGVNLGSVAISHALLDVLLEEFRDDVNDASADRRRRPDLDPQFFTALTVAAIADGAERARAWETARAESVAVRSMHEAAPDVFVRLRAALERFESRHGRPVKLVAMDFVDQYWGDIGQHAKMYDFYMALGAPGPEGDMARALAGIDATRDARGNIVVGECAIGDGVTVRDSVLIDARLEGEGRVEGCVLIGTRSKRIEAARAFDVGSTAAELVLEPRAGAYRVVSSERVHAGAGERVTTLFLPGGDEVLMRVHEDTDLRDKPASYDTPILGNALSFREAHERMSAADPDELATRRAAAEDAVRACW